MGRFLNADALVSTGQGLLGNNMFAYCLNNPVNYCDPSGNFAGDLTANGGRGFSTGNMGAGYGGGIVTSTDTVSTWVLKDIAEAAAWVTTASVYAYSNTFVDSSADRFADQQPRVHHIIPKGKFRWYGPEIVGMMNVMHDMLEKADIDINDPENLIIVSHGSHKSMHTKGYIIQIYNIMMQAQGGDRDDVLEALDYARSYVASLDKYANGW